MHGFTDDHKEGTVIFIWRPHSNLEDQETLCSRHNLVLQKREMVGKLKRNNRDHHSHTAASSTLYSYLTLWVKEALKESCSYRLLRSCLTLGQSDCTVLLILTDTSCPRSWAEKALSHPLLPDHFKWKFKPDTFHMETMCLITELWPNISIPGLGFSNIAQSKKVANWIYLTVWKDQLLYLIFHH